MRQLPRATASPRFRDDVLRAAAAPEERPFRTWLRLAATAAILVLVAGLYAASLHQSRENRLQALRAEHERIESDLRQVQARAAEIKPVVVLENDDTRVIIESSDRNANAQSTPVYY
jgi:hypothetical protein